MTTNSSNETLASPGEKVLQKAETVKKTAVRKVLIVEDVPSVQNVLRRFLERDGFQVVAMDNAEDAVSNIATKGDDFGVIFVDLHLPGMNGVDLCRQIRDARPLAVIFAVTGFDAKFSLIESRRAGADDYFIKPFDMKSILRATADAFERRARWNNTEVSFQR
ncbi:MAG: response regulator [Candidatus Wallbacteria bacterium HGW-Wallbacteria-1]|jgi:two-component system alkaline phosphatase synthesis response regulator PhoP|uniref:Response regulator n=1 Tax=Candidatus Wallbacteria bacterium HGW-Wallbacteria-1 TaxID=2013854 RepID=A0A2N1PKF6_9BACT|nr:MAG: response regulator [Candidatus Wallbacteria bacterium HGW-Wallbacteria-1]